jgi:hypothetical protein
MLVEDHFESSLPRNGGRTLSLLDRITPRVPRGSGVGEYRGQHRQLVRAHRLLAEGQEPRGTASGNFFSKRGRSRTKVFCTMDQTNC